MHSANLFELIEFSKGPKYKVNIQIKVVFLHYSNKQVVITKKISFITGTKIFSTEELMLIKGT